jgi:hypothetical protein
MKFTLTAILISAFLISCADPAVVSRFGISSANTSGGNPNSSDVKEPFGKKDEGQPGCVGQVYALPAGTKQLPTDFDNREVLSTIVAENFDIPVRAFEQGFPGVPGLFEWFAIRYRCVLVVPESGRYAFRLNSDDGSKLFIDGKLVVDNDGTHPAQIADGYLQFDGPSKHAMELQYFQGPRYHIALQLFWKRPLMMDVRNFEIIPSKYLFRWE